MIRRLSVTFALVCGFAAAPAFGNEVCKSALTKYESSTKDAAARANVLKSCGGSHGSGDALLKKLLKRCDGLLAGTASKDMIEGCKVDAYRYMAWGEYP